MNNKGVTLIALVITIIVMLMLVGVSVTVALNGEIFITAKRASDETETEKNKEHTLSSGEIVVDGNKYASYQDYLDGKVMTENPNNPDLPDTPDLPENPEKVLPSGWTEATTKPDGWSENVMAITDGTNIVPLPNGFEISIVETENSIEEGLVIREGLNEFVWVPVENASSYTEDSFGPLIEENMKSRICI